MKTFMNNQFSAEVNQPMGELPKDESRRIPDKEELALRKLHDKICQTCDGCTKNRCSFTEGYRRAKNEDTKFSTPITVILSRYAGERGETEGEIECLERIVREREILLRNAIKEKVFKLI